MGRIEDLAVRYRGHIGAPWQRNLAGDQKANMLKVDADLMRAPRVQPRFGQRLFAQPLDDAILRVRGAARVGGAHGHALAVRGVSRDGGADVAVAARQHAAEINY